VSCPPTNYGFYYEDRRPAAQTPQPRLIPEASSFEASITERRRLVDASRDVLRAYAFLAAALGLPTDGASLPGLPFILHTFGIDSGGRVAKARFALVDPAGEKDENPSRPVDRPRILGSPTRREREKRRESGSRAEVPQPVTATTRVEPLD
jgi:hypothetical protein